MKWHVYIAKAKSGYFYTGMSPTPEERIVKYNEGKGSQMGLQQGPFVLVYKSKSFPNKSEARRREAQIKRWTREKKEKLINGEWK